LRFATGASVSNLQSPIVIDLGSTKAHIVSEMQKLPAHFDPIGGHPMCGREVGGIANADENLFRDKTFILTPLERTSSRALNIAQQLITLLGAQPLILDPDHHDSLAAMVSHLPYLTSVALMHSAMTMNDDDVWRIAASGFRDTTRLASSDLTMMTDIMHTNRQAVLESLHRFRDEIDSLTTLIESSNFDSLHKKLFAAQTQRSQLFQSPISNL
ncbi:MAG: prephenate dehydrogenase/arogenate dehydrogenase family protein, partial [Chloroflexi bacterium]|nr:prephenate dehydrogenase/arogenate dehydrogenase family protein [Chloroflexota bacterium]